MDKKIRTVLLSMRRYSFYESARTAVQRCVDLAGEEAVKKGWVICTDNAGNFRGIH